METFCFYARDYDCGISVLSAFDDDGQVAIFNLIQPSARIPIFDERVVHKIADGGQHGAD
ncbi:MAG: hypothetical protein B6D38_07625 [Anaerolineae bacterium UTCFX1]|nr:MAG: hypothetical protein B6D38_07625 [Anaerolineae bacterium UTCFX1]